MTKPSAQPSEATACRLLIDPPATGSWNMAVDEVLLNWSAATGASAWRFYRWNEPTLSLGYFQTYDDRWQHAASRKCPIVRRASGGGAILHDLELTYSCVWPQGHRLASGRLELYRIVHASLVELLAEHGLEAILCNPPAPEKSDQQPFLCFQRRSPGDVLVGTVKVVGSAQRRLGGTVLQHGSILLARSPAAPELHGLTELGLSLDAEQLVQTWLPRLALRLGLSWKPEPLDAQQHQQAQILAQTKYGAEVWTVKRGR